MKTSAAILLLALGLATAPAFGRGGGGCFLPDTPILRADGTTVPLRAVRAGDELLAFTADGQPTPTRVCRVITHQVPEYLVVRTARVVLRVTAEHPFSVGEGIFQTVAALGVGDFIYAYDGHGVSAQRIASIERVRGLTTVYDLQTDSPHTFFADGILVHNKGGGGGGGGSHGGGYRSGGYSSRSGSRSQGDPRVFFFIVGAVIVVIIVVKAAQARGAADANLDFCYSETAVAAKADKTRKLLEFIARVDEAFAETALQQRATETFLKLQECWQAREYGPMRELLMPDLFAEHQGQINGLRHNHEINVIDELRVQRVDLVNVRYPHAENQREFTALITALARDYYIDDRTQAFQRGDDSAAQFQEFWTFQRQNGQWRLREVEQTRESDKLKEDNFFEPFTEKGVEQVYGEAAGKEGPAGPWLAKAVETKATRIERMLGFLGQTDSLWNQTAMVERARQVFLQVMLAQEAGDPTAVRDEDLFPAVAVDLRQEIAKRRSTSTGIEYRNLCVRKAELILVRNYTDRNEDEYTVRISAHAQKIVTRAGAVLGQDPDVMPFVEYWTFGRLDDQWKLKEVVPPAQGEGLVAEENLDQDSSPDQVQWYYKQKRAG